MKKKLRLGQLIRTHREAASLSQRELGRSLGVTASHVAYIESGARRPSRTIVFRLARTLRLNHQELLLAAYPELTPLLSPNPQTRNHQQAWRDFMAVARRHSVTPREMALMRQISRIGKISSTNSYLFILNSIRQSLEAD